ncbi:MAG: hypothetical protein ACFB4I_14845 [Cyanophyceae cyanobacterium]
MKNAIVPVTLARTEAEKNQASLVKQAVNGFKNSRLLNALWQALLYATVKSNEPRVWQKCDRQGNTRWFVYDPATSCTATFSSEQEVRIWFDERYYL